MIGSSLRAEKGSNVGQCNFCAPQPFVCAETHELGEEIPASYLYQGAPLLLARTEPIRFCYDRRRSIMRASAESAKGQLLADVICAHHRDDRCQSSSHLPSLALPLWVGFDVDLGVTSTREPATLALVGTGSRHRRKRKLHWKPKNRTEPPPRPWWESLVPKRTTPVSFFRYGNRLERGLGRRVDIGCSEH
jgi:hypothetical protein